MTSRDPELSRSRRSTSARLLARAWRYAPVLTVPVALFFVVWLWTFGGRFAAFRLRYDLGPVEFGLAQQGLAHASHMGRELWLGLSTREVPDSLPIVELVVRNDRLAALGAEPPHSGFREIDGRLRARDQWLDVRLRHRGDMPGHWAFPKKSLRVEVRQQRLAFGMSTFHLLAPKVGAQINDVAAYRLCGHLGVMAPRAEPVVLFLNGRNRGLHLLVEHLSESTLRDRGRMPGDLYVGELIARDAWTGIDNHVFQHPELWDKAAENNHFAPDTRGPLRRLCALLAAPPDDDVAAAIAELVDVAAFGRFLACETLLQSLHYDPIHNWRLAYDPYRRRFEPVVWDPIAWAWFDGRAGVPATVSIDPAVSRLQNLLLRLPPVLDARARALAGFLHGPGRPAFEAELRELIGRTAPVVPLDPDLRPGDTDAVLAAMAALPPTVARVFDTVAAAEGPQRSVRWSADGDRLLLQVRDRAPVTAIELQLLRPEASPSPPAMALRVAAAGETRDAPLAVETTADSWRLRVILPAQLLPFPRSGAWGEPLSSHAVRPTTYEVRCEGPLPPLAAVVVERSSGDRETALRSDELGPTPTDLLLGLGHGQPAPGETWSGTVEIAGLRTVTGDLRLLPGTEVRLGEGSSVIVRGRVLANGTAAAPVRFVRGDPERPWGTFALQGKGCSGSRLLHCQFAGGSGLQAADGTFDYTGMLCVHDADDVRLERCTFRGSSLFDDVIHAVYADLELHGCRVDGAPSDGVDLDQCRAIVADCSFVDCTNDGLDLMSCEVAVDACTFTRCGDKGISVGERTRLLVAGSAFTDCAIGIQSKDDSDALALNCTIAGGRRSLDGLFKNWRYGTGGRLEARRCQLLQAVEPVAADRRSRLLLRDCTVEPGPTPAPNLLLEGCDELDGPARLPRAPLPFAPAGLQSVAERLWQAAPVDRRGAQ